MQRKKTWTCPEQLHKQDIYAPKQVYNHQVNGEKSEEFYLAVLVLGFQYDTRQNMREQKRTRKNAAH